MKNINLTYKDRIEYLKEILDNPYLGTYSLKAIIDFYDHIYGHEFGELKFYKINLSHFISQLQKLCKDHHINLHSIDQQLKFEDTGFMWHLTTIIDHNSRKKDFFSISTHNHYWMHFRNYKIRFDKDNYDSLDYDNLITIEGLLEFFTKLIESYQFTANSKGTLYYLFYKLLEEADTNMDELYYKIEELFEEFVLYRDWYCEYYKTNSNFFHYYIYEDKENFYIQSLSKAHFITIREHNNGYKFIIPKAYLYEKDLEFIVEEINLHELLIN